LRRTFPALAGLNVGPDAHRSDGSAVRFLTRTRLKVADVKMIMARARS
jgi:hypothetical protein